MEDAKRKRVAARGWLTRAEKHLSELLNQPEVLSIEVVDAINEFENRLYNLDEAQTSVESVINEEELVADIECAADFRSEKRVTYLKAKEFINKKQETEVSVTVAETADRDVNTRLPKLELPKFAGDYTHWQTFWEKFKACVDSANIPDVNKFTYLQSVLEGEAAVAIRGLSLTPQNYVSAKEILSKRFGRPERIIFGHIQNLLKMNTKVVDGSAASLWKLHDDIQISVRSLQNLGVGGDTYGVILTPLILHQLPANIRLEWARDGEEHESDLDYLLKFLHDEIRRRERSQTFNSPSYPNKRYEQRQRPTATALLANEGTIDNRNRFSNVVKKCCVFCQGEHFADQCHVIKNLTYEERRTKIRSMRLCFRCLKNTHLAEQCNRLCYFCKKEHHSVLCKNKLDKNRNEKQTLPSVAQEGQSTHQGVMYSNTNERKTLMQVVKTKIDDVEVHLLFDSGSDRSFIQTAAVEKLKLRPVGQERMSFSCFSESTQKRKPKDLNLYELFHKGVKMKLLEIENICAPMFRAAVPSDVLFPFGNISFIEDYEKGHNVKIDILIGLDLYWNIVSTKSMCSEGLVAQETQFGWMLSGYWDNKEVNMKENDNDILNDKTMTMFCQTELNENLIRKMWELDSVGIQQDECCKITDQFTNNIEFHGGRYEVKLPWKSIEHKQMLMNNESHAMKRLNNLNKRIDTQLRKRYDNALSDLEKAEIIHEIPMNEINSENVTFYLPHRPIVRENSISTPVRPIFDASAKCQNGVSLNDCLDSGPNLIPDLVEILLRFRRWRFALTGDITKAFLQIKVAKEDQDVHRFLWNINDQVRHMRFDRVVFGNTSSPYLLNATLKYHLSQFEESTTVKELKSCLYVDDWLTGTDSEENLLKMMHEAETILKQGGFPMTKWASNSPLVTQSLGKSFNGFKEISSLKILGVSWKTEDDSFSFETLNVVNEDQLFTKRRLLSMIARIFDPLGLITPFTVTLKVLFQEIWRLGLDWDHPIPEEIQTQVLKWIQGMDVIRKWSIPRRVTNGAWNDLEDVEIVAFSDASLKAFGCCIYLKVHSDVNLIMSRVKIAPLKKVTLPRLELLGAVLAARLLTFVRKALELDENCKYTLWTDSLITKSWIQSEPSRWKQFISNRIIEIQELTNTANWKHCCSEDNPADLLTRGISAKTLMNSTLWLKGPQWLREPVQNESGKDKDDNLDLGNDTQPEMEIEEEKNTITSIVQSAHSDPLIEFEKFGKWGKLVRTIGWIFRFINNCKKPKGNKTMATHLRLDELNNARNKIIFYLQRINYMDEFEQLKRGEVVSKRSPISNLSPFIDDNGLLKVKGRLDFAPGLYYDERHPVILPRCHTSYLIVQAQHEVMKHAGMNTLITAVRNKYWIVGVRTMAKKICKKCIRCQRQNSRLLDQATAPLPEHRLTKSPPFHVTGVDHAGPLYCTDKEGKLYILIFTCAVTRAVHLELVESLSLNDFLMAFRRFTARRGLVAYIYSDNAMTFKGADHYIQKHYPQSNIIWKFNAPRAPWWGGWWERLIRSVKSGLKKSLGIEKVTRIELETTLHEVESCINSRPLTYVGETKQPLTPSHFLIGRGTPMMSVEPTDFGPEVRNLCERGKAVEEAIDRFWNVWKDDYLKWLPPLKLKKANEGIEIGSVVLIKTEGKSRLTWPLGIITKLYPGRDGFIRAVQLRTANGLIDRPIQNLLRLEIDGDAKDDFHTPSPMVSNEGEGTSNMGSNESKEVITQRGRVVKPRKIIDL